MPNVYSYLCDLPDRDRCPDMLLFALRVFAAPPLKMRGTGTYEQDGL